MMMYVSSRGAPRLEGKGSPGRFRELSSTEPEHGLARENRTRVHPQVRRPISQYCGSGR